MNAMTVALIPARGGSKRIPNKNIKPFAGRPLISYPIRAAMEAGLFDRIVVSTDSPKIADIARQEGAEVPFMRPPELSDDFTPTIPVIKHAIDWLNGHGCQVQYCCCIYANPFVTGANLVAAFEQLKQKRATSVIPVTTFPFPIFRGVKLNELGAVEFIFPEKSLTRTQDLDEAYHDAGQFYWWNCEQLMATQEVARLQMMNRFPLIIPRSQVQDLDTPEDWIVAEKLYHAFVMP
jgi:pseudaminic acid cytidylyltransferase